MAEVLKERTLNNEDIARMMWEEGVGVNVEILAEAVPPSEKRKVKNSWALPRMKNEK